MLNKKYSGTLDDKFTVFQYIVIWTSLIVLSALLTYSYFVGPAIDIILHGISSKSNAGVFYDGGGITILVDWIVMLGSSVILLGLPLINMAILNKKKINLIPFLFLLTLVGITLNIVILIKVIHLENLVHTT